MTEQQEKNVRRAIEWLRSGKYKQITGDYCEFVGRKKCYCAVGLMVRSTGFKFQRNGRNVFSFRELFGEIPCFYIVAKNDRGESFEQIADYLEDLAGLKAQG